MNSLLSACLACGGSELSEYLNLSTQPLANDYLSEGQPTERFPLAVAVCATCSHSQLTFAVDPERLFRHYVYVSGTTSTLRDYFHAFIDILNADFSNRRPLSLLEIASNDGTLLSLLREDGHDVLGVDPAINLLELSLANGVLTIPTFFDATVARQLRGGRDAIVAMNVLAHVADPVELLRNAASLLSSDGILYIQTSQAEMFFRGEFDTIYHEHLSYFNVRSMMALAERAGLLLSDVEIVPVHGGSYLWKLSTSGVMSERAHQRLEREDSHGLNDLALYKRFAKEAVDLSERVAREVASARTEGFSIVSYGAAAKGNTFLNFAGITPDMIIDDNPLKWGKKSPAGDALVMDPREVAAVNEPVLFVIPAWNFLNEIVGKIRNIRDERADQYLVYFPEFKRGLLEEYGI